MFEYRRKRASFTGTLERMCVRLDKEPSATVKFKNPFRITKDELTSQITVHSLWVFGSYARGAPDCGDLDIVLEFTTEKGPTPSASHVSKSLLNSPPDVRINAGTPTKNSSGAEFADAILIWNGQGSQWQQAISEIPENSTAGRFLRPTDRIPFRPEQLKLGIGALESISEMEAQNLICWEFIPLALLEQANPQGDDESELLRLAEGRGAKTQKLLPYLLWFIHNPIRWPAPQLRSNFDKNEFQLGGSMVLVGCPYVPLYLLDTLSTSELILMPHITSRGPNGIWSIRRGEKHPLVIASTGAVGYFLTDEGQPDLFTMSSRPRSINTNAPSWACAHGLELFTTKCKATECAIRIREEEGRILNVTESRDYDLFRLLSHLDCAVIDEEDFAITTIGSCVLGGLNVKSTSEISAVFNANPLTCPA